MFKATGIRSPHSSSQDSKLLQLPAELRNRIYEMVLLHPFRDFLMPGSRAGNYTVLLRTCRQIFHEAAEIYYSGNTFHTFPDTLVRALRTIGVRNRALLRGLRILHPGLRADDPRGSLRYLSSRYEDLAKEGLSLPLAVLRVLPEHGKWCNLSELEALVAEKEAAKLQDKT